MADELPFMGIFLTSRFALPLDASEPLVNVKNNLRLKMWAVVKPYHFHDLI